MVLTIDENDIENVTILPSLGISDHVVIKFDFLCSFKEHYTGKAKFKYNSCDFHLLLKTGKMKIGRINLKVWILALCGIISLNIIMKKLKNMYQNIFPKKDVNPNLNR